MQKKLLVVLVFAFLICEGQSSYEIIKGREFDVSDKRKYFWSVEPDENSFYAYRAFYTQSEPFLCRFDAKTATLQYEKNLGIKDEETILETHNQNGRIYIITVITHKKEKRKLYLLRVIKSDTGEQIGDIKVMEDIDTKKDNGGHRHFNVEFSPDGKKMMTVLDEKNEGEPRTVRAKLFNSASFSKIWEKHPVENLEKSPLYVSDFKVDNDDRFIYQGGYLNRENPDDVIYCICISPGNNPVTHFVKIPSGNKTILNPNLELFDNSLVYTGEFLDGINTSKYDGHLKTTGFFAITVDPKDAVIKGMSFEYLSPELQEKLTYKAKNLVYNTKGVTDDNKLFKHFKSIYIDGRLYVVKYHGYDYTIVNNGSSVSYHYGREIIVLKYNAETKLEKMKIIPRNTVGVERAISDKYTNHLMVTGTKKLHLIFYDRDKNLLQFPDVNNYEPSKYKGIVTFSQKTWPVYVTLNENGELSREIIKSDYQVELWNIETPNVKKSNSLLLAPQSENKNKTRMDLLTIKE